MKLFTLEEANNLLSEIKKLFSQIDRQRSILQKFAPEVKRASEQASNGGGGIPDGMRYAKALNGFMGGVQTILAHGVEVKDFDRGLCDFPSLRDGRVVYLCWQRGEDSIEWWHDIDSGFAGRQRIKEV
ncbi:MAG: DUF2203 domain-containing protein [Acidobacteria bacterium]|nr:DUF2203 domain-containing protein [Acidobacteriota bacterium]